MAGGREPWPTHLQGPVLPHPSPASSLKGSEQFASCCPDPESASVQFLLGSLEDL